MTHHARSLLACLIILALAGTSRAASQTDALFDAALRGDAAQVTASTPVVRLLLAHGAQVNATDQDGATPLTIYLGQWQTEAAVATLLLEAGAAVNVRTKDGSTPLMLAARGGKDDIVPLLLAQG